jgi:hypothetical protein
MSKTHTPRDERGPDGIGIDEFAYEAAARDELDALTGSLAAKDDGDGEPAV